MTDIGFGRYIKYYVKAPQEPQPRPRDAAQVLLAAQRRIDNICHPISVVVRNRCDEFNSMSVTKILEWGQKWNGFYHSPILVALDSV